MSFEEQFVISKEQWPIVDPFYAELGWFIDRSITGTDADKKKHQDVIVTSQAWIWDCSGTPMRKTRRFSTTLQEKVLFQLKWQAMVLGIDNEFWRIEAAYLAAFYIRGSKISSAMICNVPPLREFTIAVVKDLDDKNCRWIHQKNGKRFLWLPFALIKNHPLAQELGVIFHGPYLFDDQAKAIYDGWSKDKI